MDEFPILIEQGHGDFEFADFREFTGGRIDFETDLEVFEVGGFEAGDGGDWGVIVAEGVEETAPDAFAEGTRWSF